MSKVTTIPERAYSSTSGVPSKVEKYRKIERRYFNTADTLGLCDDCRYFDLPFFYGAIDGAWSAEHMEEEIESIYRLSPCRTL